MCARGVEASYSSAAQSGHIRTCVTFILFLIIRPSQGQVTSHSMMARLSDELRARIMNTWRTKFTVKEIVERLAEGV